MGSIPLPALDVRPQADPLESLGRVMQLKDMLERQKLVPGQLQAQQQSLQAGQQQLQQGKIALDDQRIWSDALHQTKGDFTKAGNIAATNGASFDSLVKHQSAVADLDKTLATTTKDNLENLDKQQQNLRDTYSEILALPPEEQEAAYNARKAEFHNDPETAKSVYGIADTTKIPAYPGADVLQHQADMLAGVHNLIKEKNESMTAQANATRANAAKESADTAKAGKEFAETGISASTKYTQEQENYRAALSRSAANLNQYGQAAAKQIDSMWSDPQHGYANLLSQINNAKSMISKAKTGNELASSLAPLLTVQTQNDFMQNKRVNEAEIQAAGPQVGSLWRRANTLLQKAGSGKINSDTANEMQSIFDQMLDEKQKSLLQATSQVVANSRGGVTADQAYVMGKDGNPVTLANALKPPAPDSNANQSLGHKLGDLIVQNGKTFKVTAVDASGKVTKADAQ